MAAISSYFFTRKELTQSELQKLTGLSTGTISQVVSNLVALGFVKKEPIPGTKEKLYKLRYIPFTKRSSLDSTITLYLENLKSLINSIHDKLDKLKELIINFENGGKEIDNSISNRIQRLQEFHDEYQIIIPIMNEIAYTLVKGD
jgi:DNA-binding transcriptional regulator GbsR (MarR family)